MTFDQFDGRFIIVVKLLSELFHLPQNKGTQKIPKIKIVLPFSH